MDKDNYRVYSECKYYGCTSRKNSVAKIIEYVEDRFDGISKFTGYFGNLERAENCFRNWDNRHAMYLDLVFYIKVSNRWIEVVKKVVSPKEEDLR